MTNQPAAPEPEGEGATAVITQRVRPDSRQAYQEWVKKIYATVRRRDGFLDGQVINPVPGVTQTFTVILRFVDIQSLKSWMDSVERKQLIDEVRPLLAGNDQVYIQSGFEFMFDQGEQQSQSPRRWKQTLVTWSAIYPLVLLIPMLVSPLIDTLGLPQSRYLNLFIATGMMVPLMVYVVMPTYTRLIRHWLFK